MGYTFGNFKIRNIDAANNDLLPSTNLAIIPFTPTIVRNVAIGNRIIISFEITRFGGSNFNNKQVRVNFGSWTGGDLAQALSFGFESIGFVDGVLTTGVFVPNNAQNTPPLLQKNLTARFQLTSPPVCYVEIEFYMTVDLLKYIGGAAGGTTFDRFMKSVWTGQPLTNGGDSVYFLQKLMGIKALVFNNQTSFAESVFNPANSKAIVTIPFEGKWYNSWVLGSTTGMRYMKNIEITSPNQIASGLPYLAKATASGPQNITQNVDSSFTIPSGQAMQLSSNEKNSIVIRLQGLANPALTPNPANTSIRVLLIRIDPLSNSTDFVTDLLLNDAVIPALDATATQIDGAIWNPSSWSDTGPDITDLAFTIDGSYLLQGNSYRIIVNVYDNVNSRVTSHISPELIADFSAPVTPTIIGELSTYNKTFLGNELSGLAPHSRFKSRITIDKASYEAQLLALGIVGTFDDAFVSALVQLLSVNSEPPQNGTYIKSTVTPPLDNSILSSNMEIVSNTATELVLDCFFRVDEEKAGFAVGGIFWALTMDQPTLDALVSQLVQINFIQRVGFRLFENDEGAPKLLSAKVYDFDLYPTNKVEVTNICLPRDYVIVEVEKDAAFTGSINFVATIYPADESGFTQISTIEEEEQWLPAVPLLPQLTSPKLDDVDINFVGNFAAFRVNLQQLTPGQRYWITAIAYEQFPTYCPIGLVSLTTITTIRPAAVPFWSISCDASAVAAEIIAHPDYIGGISVVYNRIVDNIGNVVGVPTYGTYTVGTQGINPINLEVYYQLRIDAIFDSGSGNHLLSHILNVTIPLPPINTPPLSYDSNAYVCADLG